MKTTTRFQTAARNARTRREQLWAAVDALGDRADATFPLCMLLDGQPASRRDIILAAAGL